MAERITERSARVPLTTRLCAFICLVMTIALTLYGYMRGFYFSFVGPFIIIICVVVMVKGTRPQRRRQRPIIIERPLNLTDSETEIARHNPITLIQCRPEASVEINRDSDAQQSLLQRYDQETGAESESTWIWRRPPSYSNEAMTDAEGVLPPSYHDAMRSSSNCQQTSPISLHEEGLTLHSASPHSTSPVEEGIERLIDDMNISSLYESETTSLPVHGISQTSTCNQMIPFPLSHNLIPPPSYERTSQSPSNERISRSSSHERISPSPSYERISPAPSYEGSVSLTPTET